MRADKLIRNGDSKKKRQTTIEGRVIVGGRKSNSANNRPKGGSYCENGSRISRGVAKGNIMGLNRESFYHQNLIGWYLSDLGSFLERKMACYAPRMCRKSTAVADGWAPAHVKAVKGAIRI